MTLVYTTRQKRLSKEAHSVRKCASVIFAFGELYCFAVIFGLKSKLYSLREFWGEYNITKTARF